MKFQKMRRWLVIMTLATGLTAGIVALDAAPALALPDDTCQDLANEAAVYVTYTHFYNDLGQYYLSFGDYADAAVAFDWSIAYSSLAQQDLSMARSAGC